MSTPRWKSPQGRGGRTRREATERERVADAGSTSEGRCERESEDLCLVLGQNPVRSSSRRALPEGPWLLALCLSAVTRRVTYPIKTQHPHLCKVNNPRTHLSEPFSGLNEWLYEPRSE